MKGRLALLLAAAATSSAGAFVVPPPPTAAPGARTGTGTGTALQATSTGGTKAPSASELQQSSPFKALAAVGDALATTLVGSPLYPVLLKQARQTMKDAVAKIDVPWDATVAERTAARDWEAAVEAVRASAPDTKVPDYYLRKFHAYEAGNLCLEAAIEQDLASRAVGVRNFPESAKEGERKLRASYNQCLTELGAVVPEGSTLVDFGCGTGISTVDLARQYPHAGKVIGVDLSPHMIAVGQYLLEEKRGGVGGGVGGGAGGGGAGAGGAGGGGAAGGSGTPTIEFMYGDIATQLLPAESVAMVSFNLVLHELPNDARRAAFAEAYRILRPGGVLGIMEMDPDAPGYVKLRANVMLYTIMKSTEPYLDQYFGSAGSLMGELRDAGFAVMREAAATGRHKAVVAFKAGAVDTRGEPASRMRTAAK